MHPADCPVWEYADHPNRSTVLPAETKYVLLQLRRGALDSARTSGDTRAIHRRLFEQLAPPHHDYYAGNYRGDSYRCLRHYSVGVAGDPRVGSHPSAVGLEMDALSVTVATAIAGLDAGASLPNAQLSQRDKLVYIVAVACRVLVEFLRIHPYANGNGHAGRFLIWAILGRYGYWPYRWPIEPRPPDPPYTDLIKRYRDGEHEPLERYVLQSLQP